MVRLQRKGLGINETDRRCGRSLDISGLGRSLVDTAFRENSKEPIIKGFVRSIK